MQLSLAQRVIKLNKPFVLYHTYSVTANSVNQAIHENKSMDLDIAVDNKGNPYIGHSLEYYQVSGETQPECMPFEEAVSSIVKGNIPIIVDCKQPEAWPIVEEVVKKIGADRCLVHTYASELKFDYNFYDHDYPSEWLPISKLTLLKDLYPNVTTTVSCKFLPNDFLLSDKYEDVLLRIRTVLKNNKIDTVCLNVPNESYNDKVLKFFLDENIIPHIGVDNVDLSKVIQTYIGETDILKNASSCNLLNY